MVTKVNPYDFANPVSDSSLLAGRASEMREITYYLDQASMVVNPINIALHGDRASGKTSILNIIEQEAKSRDYCVVRIDLDEGDTSSTLTFYYKMFDALITAVTSSGAFGGINGRVYNVYLDMVSAYKIPEEKNFCPFRFPIRYAKAMAAGVGEVLGADLDFRHDIDMMQKEIQKPIVILIDEGNVLSKSIVLLEKIRNNFMNAKGFMLVLAGTHDLFPLMDEVFSPVSRQFKRIFIGSFKNIQDTRACIVRPVESIGIDPHTIMDVRTLSSDIHDLSGGRPYEIQLICHVLFRRMQMQELSGLQLNMSAIEEIQEELQSTNRISPDSPLAKIRELTAAQLKALRLFVTCDGRATFEQIWGIEYIAAGESNWSMEQLKREYNHLLSDGILLETNGNISFFGDEFDKIVVKYICREKQANVRVNNRSIANFWEMRLGDFLYSDKITTHPTPISDMLHGHSIASCVREISNPTSTEFVARHLAGMSFLYDLAFRHSLEDVTLLSVRTDAFWFTSDSIFALRSVPEGIDEIVKRPVMASVMRRMREMGGELSFRFTQMPFIDPSIIIERIVESGSKPFASHLLWDHYSVVVKSYEVGSVNRAVAEYARIFAKALIVMGGVREFPLEHIQESDPGAFLANVGYMMMITGELEGARSLTEYALSITESQSSRAIQYFNMGVLQLKEGRLEQAAEAFRLALEAALREPGISEGVLCLLIPELVDGKVKYEEMSAPDLVQVCRAGVELAGTLLR